MLLAPSHTKCNYGGVRRRGDGALQHKPAFFNSTLLTMEDVTLSRITCPRTSNRKYFLWTGRDLEQDRAATGTPFLSRFFKMFLFIHVFFFALLRPFVALQRSDLPHSADLHVCLVTPTSCSRSFACRVCFFLFFFASPNTNKLDIREASVYSGRTLWFAVSRRSFRLSAPPFSLSSIAGAPAS